MMSTEDERRRAVEDYRASAALEGMYPSKESTIYAEQWIRGEITIEEWLNRVQEKYRK